MQTTSSELARNTYFRRVLGAVLLTTLVIGNSCSLVGADSEPHHDQAVIATGRHCVDQDPGGGCRAATIVSNKPELLAALGMWGYTADAASFSGGALVFVGVDESSTCPYQVDDVVVVDHALEVTIRTLDSGDCTSDAGHRSLILRPAEAGLIDHVVVNGTEVQLLNP